MGNRNNLIDTAILGGICMFNLGLGIRGLSNDLIQRYNIRQQEYSRAEKITPELIKRTDELMPNDPLRHMYLASLAAAGAAGFVGYSLARKRENL